jgi:hypothetical protein
VVAINVVSDCANEGRALASGPDATRACSVGQSDDKPIDITSAGVRCRKGDFGRHLARTASKHEPNGVRIAGNLGIALGRRPLDRNVRATHVDVLSPSVERDDGHVGMHPGGPAERGAEKGGA